MTGGLDSKDLADLAPYLEGHGVSLVNYTTILGGVANVQARQNVTFERVRAVRHLAGEERIDLIEVNINFTNDYIWIVEIFLDNGQGRPF